MQESVVSRRRRYPTTFGYLSLARTRRRLKEKKLSGIWVEQSCRNSQLDQTSLIENKKKIVA